MALSNVQKSIVETTTDMCIIVAGPGSGKTTTLLARAVHLCDYYTQKWGRSARILMLTFSNQSAKDMGNRLLKQHPNYVDRINVSTIHASVIKNYPQYSKNMTLLSEKEQDILLKNAMAKCAWTANTKRDARYTIGKLMQNLEPSASNYENILFNEYVTLIDNFNGFTFELLLRRYAQDLRDGRVDALPADHILIDEVQDLDRMQNCILQLQYQYRIDQTRVGDDDQSIYGFRGAIGKDALDFEVAHRKTTFFELAINYRSGRHIVAAGSRLINHNRKRLYKVHNPHQTFNGKVNVVGCHSDDEETNFILKCAADNIEHGKNVMILARTNDDLDKISRECERMRPSLPYVRKEKDDDLFSGAYPTAFKHLLLSLDPAFHDQRESRIAMALAAMGIDGDIFNSIHIDKYGRLKIELNSPNKKFKSALQILEKQWSSWLSRVHEEQYRHAIDVVAMFLMGVNNDCYSKIYFLKNKLQSLNKSISNRIDFLMRANDRTPSNEEESMEPNKKGTLQLITFHSAKGLEADIVYMFNCREPKIKILQNVSTESEIAHHNLRELEEERRLFFVGLTRAIEECYCVWHENPSRFLREIGAPITGRPLPPD